jgi:hypothetical protein
MTRMSCAVRVSTTSGRTSLSVTTMSTASSPNTRAGATRSNLPESAITTTEVAIERSARSVRISGM